MIPVPDEWYFNYEKKGDTIAYFLSKENYKTIGYFQTGLTMNIFPKLKNFNIDSYIRKFSGTLALDNEILNNE